MDFYFRYRRGLPEEGSLMRSARLRDSPFSRLRVEATVQYADGVAHFGLLASWGAVLGAEVLGPIFWVQHSKMAIPQNSGGCMLSPQRLCELHDR